VSQKRGVIVIGNDRTDRCVAAWFADFVFIRLAKHQHPDENALVTICRELGKDYRVFYNFKEVVEELNRLMNDYQFLDKKKSLISWTNNRRQFRDSLSSIKRIMKKK
jgi:hypothetical protein